MLIFALYITIHGKSFLLKRKDMLIIQKVSDFILINEFVF